MDFWRPLLRLWRGGAGWRLVLAGCRCCMQRELNSNLSGSKVYYTNSLILLVNEILGSKVHYQKGFNLFVFLYEICSMEVAVLLLVI